jgi:hypothetical protein
MHGCRWDFHPSLPLLCLNLTRKQPAQHGMTVPSIDTVPFLTAPLLPCVRFEMSYAISRDGNEALARSECHLRHKRLHQITNKWRLSSNDMIWPVWKLRCLIVLRYR